MQHRNHEGNWGFERIRRLCVTTPAAFLVLPLLAAQVKEFKPGFNLFSVDQDIQMGKEAAAEVRKTMTVVDNQELTGYLTRVGQRLAKSKHAGSFPYTFQVVNDKSINAFALPGGPMFIHTGLISAADNESQIAGVLAHEMSHVALRHGTNQASKANLIQLPATLAGGVLGNGSLWGQMTQMGMGLGAKSVLLKYSRGAEHDADLNGAQIMNDAGYDPVQMARFFEKLEGDGRNENSGLANFLADHPTPGRRIDYISEQNKYLPKVSYSESEPGTLARMKQLVAALPAPQPAATAGQSSASARPSGRYKQFQSSHYRINYPDNWDAYGDQKAPVVTIAPKAGLVADANNRTAIAYGMMVSYYIPETRGSELNPDTAALVKQLQQANGLRANGNARSVQVAGQKALMTPFESQSPSQGEVETDVLVTLARPEGLFYILFVTPRPEWDAASRDLNNILGSVQFQ